LTSKCIWQYYLIVPEGQVESANTVSPALNNPDGVEATFQPYPVNSEEPTHWVSSFIATENASDGNPSREMLDYFSAGMTGILWVRTKNPHHPDTTEAEKGIVVASNWAAFPVGSAVNWDAVITAVGELP